MPTAEPQYVAAVANQDADFHPIARGQGPRDTRGGSQKAARKVPWRLGLLFVGFFIAMSACSATIGPEGTDRCEVRTGVQTVEDLDDDFPLCGGPPAGRAAPSANQMNDLTSRAQASGIDDIEMDRFLDLVLNTCASLRGRAEPDEIAAEFPTWYPARFGRFAPGRDKEFVIAIQRQGWCRLD